jgi:hypothetical protein
MQQGLSQVAQTKYVTTPDGRRITYDRWRYEQAVTQEATLKRVDTLITNAGTRVASVGRSLAQQEYGGLLRTAIPNLLNDYGAINATAAVNYYDELRTVFRETYPDRRAQYSRNAIRSQTNRYATARTQAAIALNLTDPDDFAARFAPTYNVAAKSDNVVNYAMKIRAQYGHEPSVQAMNNALTREVSMYHRDTILFNSALDPYVQKVQRVAQASACEFCRLMALGSTNGEVRVSTYAAKFHDNCHCTIQPLYQGEEAIRPDYYDDFEEQYTTATRNAKGRSAKDILAEMRKLQAKPASVPVSAPAVRAPSAKVTPGSLDPSLTNDWYFLRPEGRGGLTVTEIIAQRQLAQKVKLDESGYSLKRLKQSDTLEQAAKNTNPRFEEDSLYKRNCARVVNAYELRRRGFDVTANKKVSDNSQTDPVFQGTWINPETGATAWDERFLMSNRIRAEKRAEQTALTILSKYPEGARGAVSFSYRNSKGAGHVFNWEVQDGEVIWVDAQPNKVGDARKGIFEMATNISVTRYDDKVPNISVLQFLETGIE